MNCQACGNTGWIVGEDGARRCKSCFGSTQRNAERSRIDDASLAMAVRGLSVLAFFPTDRIAQTVVGDALAAMCPSVESLRHVVRRATELYRSWDKCGVPGLRQIVCSKFRPADGIESGPTEQFPEGLPSETGHNPLALPAGAMKELPEGHTVTAGPRMEAAFQLAAETVKLRSAAMGRPVTKQEIESAPQWLRKLEGYE